MAGWRYRIYEFLDDDGHSTVGRWLDDERISKRDRLLLVAKTDMLALNGSELLTGLLAGPIASKRNPRMRSHIYKLVIHGERMLRPMLCKGPFDMDDEFTFLLGAIEVGGELDQDAEEAETRRTLLLSDRFRRASNGRYK